MYLHLRAHTYRKGVFGNLAVPSAALVQVLTQVETLFGKAIEEMLPSDRLSAEMAMLLFDWQYVQPTLMMMRLVSSYLVSNHLLLQVSDKETDAGQTQQTLQKSSVGSFKVVGPWLWNSLPFANQCSGTVPSSIKSLNTKTRILLTVTMQS